MMCNTPILFLIFKRPDVTAQVLAAIRQAQPSKLYIAADGARPDKEGEAEKVAQTRELVLNGIDWPCEVKTLLRETNLGCRTAVSSAIDWFFEQEAEGIILEDDCLPDQSFFRFCEELLDYYRHDTRIMAISGNNFQQGQQRGKYSYYFSQHAYLWGWAGWRRAWCKYHSSLSHFDEILAERAYQWFTDTPLVNKRRKQHFCDAYSRKIDSWGYLWQFTVFVNHGLVIVPQVNVVQNIGFGEEATHTLGSGKKFSITRTSIIFPLSHPPYMCLHKEADQFFYRQSHIGKPAKSLFHRITKTYRDRFRRLLRYV